MKYFIIALTKKLKLFVEIIIILLMIQKMEYQFVKMNAIIYL